MDTLISQTKINSASSLIIKPCSSSELEQWGIFLNHNFGYEKPHNFLVDFAPLFEPEALRLSRLIWSKSEIVASATLYPVTIQTISSTGGTANQQIRLGIVGAVATDSRFRGLGLSRKILDELERFADFLQLEGLLLWSDKPDFYSSLGFHGAGKQQIFPLKELPMPNQIPPGQISYDWSEDQIRLIYDRHPLKTLRSDNHWEAIRKISSSVRAQWINPRGEVLAYIAYDRGRDMQNIIHEWGGAPQALHALVWAALKTRPHLFWLTHPHLNDPIRKLLPPSVIPAVDGGLALFKMVGTKLRPADLDHVWFWGFDSL